LIQELLILLLSRGETTKQPNWKLKQHDIEALHFAREIIIQEGRNYDSEDLYDTADQLADKVDLSLYKLKRGFKQLFGISPYHLLVEIRLHKARMLLKNTSLTILEIAMKTGYRSPESFAKAYKKLFGISPSDERK
jgi:AraC-like DNA-binding protein